MSAVLYERHEVRRARYAVAAVFAVHGAVTGSFATRVPWIQDHASVSAGQLGLALAFPALGASLAMPLAGRVSHRFGARTALRGLISLWTLSLALPALAPNLPTLCLALFVYGATAGMADVAMNALGVEIENRLGRSIMSGLHGMWSAGALIGAAGGTLAAHLGSDARLHHVLAAATLTVVGVGACRWVLDLRPTEDEEPPPRFALPPRSALLIGAVGFCAVFAEGASLDWSAVYLRDELGTSDGLAAASTTGFMLTMAVARLVGDSVVNRFGAVRTVRAGCARRTRRCADRGRGTSRHGDDRLRAARPRHRRGRPAVLRGGWPQWPQPQSGHRGRRHHHVHLGAGRAERDRYAGPGNEPGGVVRAGHGAGGWARRVRGGVARRREGPPEGHSAERRSSRPQALNRSLHGVGRRVPASSRTSTRVPRAYVTSPSAEQSRKP